jgi:regulation of enolase protein 1 (concanavalin A-like superfamily)
MNFAWLNEPPRWREADGRLDVTTGERTDFWRETHYGFIRDDGHLRYTEVSGNFTATVAFSGRYEALYDQAGIMLRLDARNWIKAGVEFVGGKQMLSAVVTRDFSDWSTMPLSGDHDWIHLRCTRQASAVRLEWSDGKTAFSLFRLAYLPARDPILVGAMCCSPERAGFEASFRNFEIGPATKEALHES